MHTVTKLESNFKVNEILGKYFFYIDNLIGASIECLGGEEQTLDFMLDYSTRHKLNNLNEITKPHLQNYLEGFLELI